MLGIAVALLAGCGTGAAMRLCRIGWGWSVTCGVLAFFVVQLVVGLVIRYVMKGRQAIMQSEMQQAQEKIDRQITLYQRRPPRSMKEGQETLERIQASASRRMLELIDECQWVSRLNFMMGRQLNAMRVHLYFQLHDYRKVDELLPKSLLVAEQTLAIKLVRMYRNDDAGIDKFYKSKCSKMKGDAGAFLACVYAWIKLKAGDQQGAVNALVDAKGRSDHQALLDNCDKLLNGRAKQFSNSGFGDQWYFLGLEEPKRKPQRQTRMY